MICPTHNLVLVGLNFACLAHRLQHISVVLAALLACRDERGGGGDGLGGWLGGCLGALGLQMEEGGRGDLTSEAVTIWCVKSSDDLLCWFVLLEVPYDRVESRRTGQGALSVW